MDTYYNIDEELITRYLAGEALPEEAVALHEWMEVSEENKRTFIQMEKAWGLGQDKMIINSHEKIEAWEILSNRIKTDHQENARRRNLGSMYRMAASITLISIVVSLLIYIKTRNQSAAVQLLTHTSKNTILREKLPDSTHIVLNRNSIFKYPEKFIAHHRTVSLIGECYFDVMHQDNNPFLIQTKEVTIKVLGTAFNVREDSMQHMLEVQVTRGKILMYTNSDSIVVHAGETGVYNNQENEFKLVNYTIPNKIGYVTGTLVFNDNSLSEIISDLGKTFGVNILLDNKELGNCRMSSTFDNQSLEYILQVIATTFKISYEIKGNTVNIAGNGCD